MYRRFLKSILAQRYQGLNPKPQRGGRLHQPSSIELRSSEEELGKNAPNVTIKLQRSGRLL